MDLLKKKAIVEIQNEDISKKMKKLKEEMQQYNQDWVNNISANFIVLCWTYECDLLTLFIEYKRFLEIQTNFVDLVFNRTDEIAESY